MAQIEMQAALEGAEAVAAGMEYQRVGSFIVDTLETTMTYELLEEFASDERDVKIHGFVPRGWSTDPVFEIPSAGREGSWRYEEWQEKNILAGLSYLTIRPRKGDGPILRAQLEPLGLPEPSLEDFVTVTALAGSCQTSVSFPGAGTDIPIEMEPAQVILARTAAQETDTGHREQIIGCAVRVGGGEVPGIGRIEIQMFGEENPGHIISMQKEADFPARMTLDVRKRYITPLGNFYSDREEFMAENIQRFPPFGVKFTPIQPTVPLRDEKTGEVVGELKLGWLVPLCYVDAANFPPRAFPVPTVDNDHTI